MGEMDVTRNLGQQWDLSDQQNEIDHLRSQLKEKTAKATSIEERMEVLEYENAELKLYLTALVRCLTSKDIVAREDIAAMVAAIDESDGRKDGKYRGSI